MEKINEKLESNEIENIESEEKQNKKTKENKIKVSQSFIDTIKNYLDQYAKENEFFKNKYSNTNKTIEECCEFIISEVQKMQVNGLADDEVYYLARHYYEEDNLKIESISNSLKVVVNHHIELTEEEKNAAKEKALKDFKEAERKKLEDKAKKKTEKEKKKEEEKKAKVGQVSLFDL